MKKSIKITLIAGSLVLLSVFIAIIFRDAILRKYIKSAENKFHQRYKGTLRIQNPAFSGLNGIQFDSFSLLDSLSDTIVYANNIQIKISLSNLFLFRVHPESAGISALKLNLSRENKKLNFAFLLHPKDTSNKVSKTGMNKQVKKLMDLIFNKIPDNFQCENYLISLKNDNDSTQLKGSISIKNKELSLTCKENENEIICNGLINSADQNFKLKIVPQSTDREVPLFKTLAGVTASMDSMTINLDNSSYSGNTSTFSGYLSLSELSVFHPKVNPQHEVKLHSAGLKFNVSIEENNIFLDTTSIGILNSIRVKPVIKYEKDIKTISLHLKMHSTPSQDFFNSLPDGLFGTLEGIETTGNLKYTLDFIYPLENPDSIQFNSELKKDNFRIKKFGKEFFSRLNNSFPYTAYEKGVPVKTFMVGPENPDFTPLYAISTHLKNAVLTSEDGGFYLHRGFNEEAFRKSIIDNIHKGKFARGGSTISMQLVKNVFLNRNKTIGRKLEEVLIVWLIENNGLVPKDRMYEVYLNIIEWGPMIYGIKEASEFYFNKRPSDLTLPESIFLASIIPSPKAFKYSFEKDGTLKNRLYGYFRLMSAHMLKKGFISEDEANNLYPAIELKGKARNFIIPSDSLPENFLMNN